MKIGELVRPAKPTGVWRLGRIEMRDEPSGKWGVRFYVAPEGAYAGVLAHFAADELVVVPLESAVSHLIVVRAEMVRRAQFAAQVAEAIAAVERETDPCSCGGKPGAHREGCAIAAALKE